MKITTLVENTSGGDCKAVHGLSFYVETKQHRLLFDLGPDKTVFENAKKLGVDLGAVDTVVISHGHYDHGGALRQFLELNKTAKGRASMPAHKRSRTGVNGMARIVIVVEGGLVQEVFSSEKDTDVTVIDLDTEEGQAAEPETEMPKFKVW